MLIKPDEKFHVVMRRHYVGQVQRHFIGKVDAVEGSVVRATGYVFIYEEMSAQYVKKEVPRTTVLDLAESGYIVNFIPQTVNIDELRYETIERTYLALTDGKGFLLDINEFGTKR
ncbi:MAG: hypothetical protein KJO95_06695 [Gammaproteobacteria bacterium]|nr:hypothetical protein [Gammaproteobacteria bacterium]